MTRNKRILAFIIVLWFAPAICSALYQPIGIVRSLIVNSMATVFSDTYDTATPGGGDSPTEADDRMREIKAAVQQRENVDHYWPLTGTEVSDADAGEHRKVLFHEPIAATPTVASNHGDLRLKDVAAKAELHWTDEDENEVQLTTAGSMGGSSTTIAGQSLTVSGSANLGISSESTTAGSSLRLFDNGTTGGQEAVLTRTSDVLVLSNGGGDNRLGTATSAATANDRQIADKGYVDTQVAAIQDPTYSGGESHVFDGGLIIKMGVTSVTDGGTVTFGSAFPTAIIAVIPILETASDLVTTVKSKSAASFDVNHNGGGSINCNWIAIGH